MKSEWKFGGIVSGGTLLTPFLPRPHKYCEVWVLVGVILFCVSYALSEDPKPTIQVQLAPQQPAMNTAATLGRKVSFGGLRGAEALLHVGLSFVVAPAGAKAQCSVVLWHG